MADYSGGKGLRTYTVQESLNQHLGKIIRVDATDITLGETNANAVVHSTLEIPNAVSVPGGTSILRKIMIVDKDLEKHDLKLIFMEDNISLGTIDSAPDIDTPTFFNSIIGTIDVDWSLGDTDISTLSSIWNSGGEAGDISEMTPLMLQAAEGSTSVYMGCLAQGVAIDFAVASDLKYIFHIEYR